MWLPNERERKIEFIDDAPRKQRQGKGGLERVRKASGINITSQIPNCFDRLSEYRSEP